MKNGFVRLACIFIMIAVLLTGCNLIEVDQVMQANEDMENLKADYARTVVTYNGGAITKGDLMADYVYQYSYLAYMYSMYYGTSISQEEATDLALSVAQSYMNTLAVLKKADELGITLTEEEIAQCEEYAQSSYDADYATYYESAEGDTEEVRAMNAEYAMLSQGLTYDMYYHQQEWDLLITKTQEAIVAEAPVLTEEELEALLAEQVLADEQTYSSDFYSFETNMNDSSIVVTWMPEGYRTVQHILIVPSEETLDAYAAATEAVTSANGELSTLNNERLDIRSGEAGEGARTEDEVQADIDALNAEIETLEAEVEAAEAACIASVQERIDEVYARLEAGEDFAAVMAEYGEDPGMQAEPAMTRGYYVSEQSQAWDYNFRNGAMELENVGDYSAEPVVSASGVHIIYYMSDVTSGAVTLDDVREAFTASAQDEANTAYFDEQCAAWVAELNPQYDIENFFASED